MTNPIPPASGDETRAALDAVLQDQEQRAQLRDRTARPARKDGPLKVVMASALAALTVWVWVSPPSLVRPPPPPPLAAPVVEAELRLTLYQAVLSVEAYRERTGALPGDLIEALGGPEGTDWLTYDRLDDGRFRLTGVRGAHRVRYETGDSMSARPGSARRMLETRR